jgi:RNA polymerase sporulation-specific sigma factor
MNDYEIIYLIKHQRDEDALAFMLKKYEKFIWKNIHAMYVTEDEKHDFFQESLILLNKAIQTFDESYNKTFTRYFELILKRRLFALKKESQMYVVRESSFFYQLESPETKKEPDQPIFKNHQQQMVYFYYFESHRAIEYISNTLNLSKKQVYNIIYQIKKIIKKTNS